jgi:eukaryotic-like serine/threonine-protein kinase
MRVGHVVADRFQLEELAGEGGMGSVYRARELHSSKQVALKLLHGSGPASDQERFAREARVLADLHHPGIVRYVAHGFTRTGEPYLAMEWLEGQTLSDRLAHGRIPLDESVLLARRVAEALGATHAHDIVHRDIKPQNLFLPDGDVDRVKLVDFGIARRKIETRPLTRTNAFVGTPAYTAPEQARGSTEVSAQADVFSLGCVLFECLTGRPPFVGDNLMAILVKILFDEAPNVSELRPDVPLALDELVARMLCKDPSGRPADGAALAAELATLDLLRAPAEASRSQPPPSLTTGEQRLVSVMLAGVAPDSEGEPARTLTPEEVTAPFERLRAIVAPLAARIDRLADGSAIATFTGQGSASDQAIQAARGALAMRTALPDVAIVLATGRSMLDGRLVVGEAIDRAVELLRTYGHSGAARVPGASGAAVDRRRILLDDITAGLIEARFEIGGAPGALELAAERDAEEGIRTLLGKPIPCVGRDRELATLDWMFKECVTEPVARPVLITGPAGMGKSRLRYEFLRGVRRRGVPPGAEAPVDIWIAQGDPLRAGSPFGMIGQLIRRAAGVLEGEPLEVRQRKLRSRVARHVAPAHAARTTEFLGELAGTSFPDQDSVLLRNARRDPIVMGEHMKQSWGRFLTAECRAHPLLLILEDLHWSDPPSVQLIEETLRALPEQPLMVLACARPEIHELFPKLWLDVGAHEVRLAKLSRKASVRLMRQVLGEDISDERIARVVEQAAGNVLYLEELIRAVADDSQHALPGTVLAMLQSRLEALEPPARQVIRAASVFGEVFWGGGVATLLGDAQDTPRVDDWLAALAERELLARRGESKFPAEQEYMFRHALVREAAYEMLIDRDRTVGHRLAGEWLERMGEQDAMVLAEHFERGGKKAHAATFYHRAAEQALEANDAAAVIERADRALSCGAAGELRGAVLRLKGEAYFDLRWDLAEAEACEFGAMQLLPRGSSHWFRAVGGVAITAFHRGRHDRLMAMVEELVSPAEPSARASQVVALALAVRMLLRAGELKVADRLFATLAALKDEVTHDPMAFGHLYATLADRALFEGDPAAARAALETSVEHFEQAGHATYLLVRRMSAAMTLVELGQYAGAESELRAVLEQIRHSQHKRLASVVKCRLGLALARRGSLLEAHALAEESVAAFKPHGDRFYESVARGYFALILMEAGLTDAAQTEAEQAVNVCEARSRRCAALGILAHVRLRQGLAREAHQAADEAMRILGPLGGLEEGEALVRLVFAESLDAIDEGDAARAALLAAEERLLARAARIDNPAWRSSFLEQVPENARTLELARQRRSPPENWNS